MKKIIALILMIALFGVGGFYVLQLEHNETDNMRDLYTNVEPLERQKETLEAERKDLETDFAVKTRDYGTLEILFTELDEQIVSDVWPIMRERGIVGMLPVGMNEMPGFYGKLTHTDILSLLSDGWGLCLLVDEDPYNLGDYYKNIAARLDQYKIPAPKTVYFKNNVYKEEMNDTLVECGIQTVILDASDGRSMTVTDINQKLWFTGAMTWGYTGSMADLELLGRTDGGNLVLTYKLNEIWNVMKTKNIASQERAAFIATLDSWKELIYSEDPLQEMETVGPTPYIYVDTSDPEVLHEIYLSSLTPEQQLLIPKIRSVSTDTALELHRSIQANAEILRRDMENKRNELDKQIDEIDTAIKNAYSQYGIKTTNQERA